MGIAVKNIRPQEIDKQDKEEEDPYEFPHVPFDYDYDDEGYLVSDGQPMAEYDSNRQQMTDTIEALKTYYGDRDVYVSGNNYVHYREGDFTRHVSPDCYVVFGAPNDLKENYKSWKHGGHVPAIVFEFTSRKTWKEDQEKKFNIYERLIGVPEYILFDPKGRYIKSHLQGYRLNAAGEYETIPMENGCLYSEQLKMRLDVIGAKLRLFDPEAGEYLRTPQEEAKARKEAACLAEKERLRANREARARREAEHRVEDAEAENARLRAELEALRRERGL